MKSIKLQVANIAVSNRQRMDEGENAGIGEGKRQQVAPEARSGGMRNLHKTATTNFNIYFTNTTCLYKFQTTAGSQMPHYTPRIVTLSFGHARAL
jgi:hypothetical protein